MRRHQTGHESYKIKPASEPTQAIPGSPDKIRVLTDRASKHEEMVHPQDLTLDQADREDKGLEREWLIGEEYSPRTSTNGLKTRKYDTKKTNRKKLSPWQKVRKYKL